MNFLAILLVSIFWDSSHVSCNSVKVQLNSEEGKQYNLNLVKSEESILHPNIKVISIRDENGLLSYESWTPSKEDLQQDIYVDEQNLAAVRFNQGYEMEGVVDGQRLETVNGQSVLKRASNQNRSDYIDVGRKITHANINTRQSGTEAVVETLLVLDKEFGDVFNHDRRRILDYLTVYFWDVNLRYKTLPNSRISFRITGVVIISSPSGQPFIEEARAGDGRAEFGRILERFSFWVYREMGNFPKFDMAAAITNTNLEWGGGLAYYRTACHMDHNSRRHYATLVWNDNGAWDSLTVGAHEIGHSVGAPHDDDENFPGGCSDRGYIMSGGNDDLKWFFSTCTDRVVGEFVRSNEASCLRRIDESGSPAIDPSFSSVQASSMDDQCKRRLRNQNAFVKAEDSTCKVMKCWVPSDGGWLIWSMAPVDNSPCENNGRCFRGRCRKQGSLIMNVGTGKCMRASNPFNHMTIVEMVDCIRQGTGTPLDRFVINAESNGKKLATPWNTPNANENGDKCVWTGNSEGDTLWTDRCDSGNGWHGWDFVDVGNGEFLLQHRITQRCAKASGNYIQSLSCNRNDREMRWKLQ